MQDESLTLSRYKFLKSLGIDQLETMHNSDVSYFERKIIYMIIMTHYAEKMLESLREKEAREKGK